MSMYEILDEYKELYKELIDYEINLIPLCAAENYVSDFVMQPLNSLYEGKYSCKNSDGSNMFVEGKYIDKLNVLLQKTCKKVFNAEYSNADTLTGINCFTVTALSLLNSKDKVLLTTPEQGGHPSIPYILKSLSIDYTTIPYDFEKFQINYERTNELCYSGEYSFIIFCQSDLLQQPKLQNLNIPNDMGIIYDATQTLGLIASKCNDNPLNYHKNVVLIGGSHKTLPAPACGLVMTNNSTYIEKLKKNINPIFLRNTQPNHIASLLLALIEQEEYGNKYQKNVIKSANILGKSLDSYNFNVQKISDNLYTNTHQIFIKMPKSQAETFFNNAQKYNISLNIKNKKLFGGYGIRLGTQQIARYNWNEFNISMLAKLLNSIRINNPNHDTIMAIRNVLINMKTPHFTYDDITIE